MNAIDMLTKQEYAILALIAQGWRTAKIARELFISPRTVESHIYHIFDKLGVSSRTEAALYALNASRMISRTFNGNPDNMLDRSSILTDVR